MRGVLFLLALLGAQDRADLKRARLAWRSGDYSGAEKSYAALAGRKPDRWSYREGHLRALLAQGKRDDAARACDLFLRTAPDHPGALVARGLVALKRGRPERTLELLKGRHDDVRARSLAAQALVALDRIDEAVKIAEPLVETYNKNRDEYMKAQLMAVGRGLVLYANHAGESEIYKQVVGSVIPEILRAAPDDARARAFLGRCFLDKYNRTAAAQEFARALQADARCVPALVGQARLILSQGNAPAAAALCARALAVNPAAGEAHALLARTHLARNDPGAAVKALDKGLETNPDSVPLLSLRAAARRVRGDADFEEDATKALAIRARSPLPDWEIARSYVRGDFRQFDAAQERFKKAVERSPRVPDLLIEYAMNCLRVGDEETGLRLLKEANDKDPFHVAVNNLVNLFDDFESKYVTLTPDHFRVRIARSERTWMEPHVTELLARAWKEMTKRYGFAPAEPVLVEVFPSHTPFSVRTVGVPDLGALGACFGRVVTTLSPRARDRSSLPPFRWSAVLWHEMAHVFSLQLSEYRVPLWLTEGLATHEERLGFGSGRRDAPLKLLVARRRDLLKGVAGLASGAPTRDRTLTVYLQGAEICAFMEEKHGFKSFIRLLRAYAAKKDTPTAFKEVFGKTVEEFDREFFAWLDGKLATFRYRLPPTEPVAALTAAATASPKDAAAKLAFALLRGGKAEDAEIWARKAVEADPKSTDANSALGRALVKRGQAAEAIPHLEKGSDDYQNWDALGRAHGKEANWKEAAAAYRKAVACFSAHLEDHAWRRLNDALLKLKDYDGATDAFAALVAANPTDFANRLKLARLHRERGETEKAAARLREASRVEVRDLDLLDLQAEVYRENRQYEKATARTLAAIALIVALAPQDEAAKKAERICAVGEDWLARGRKDKAQEYAREALKLVSGLERARNLFEASQ